jgi:hypothetical protein
VNELWIELLSTNRRIIALSSPVMARIDNARSTTTTTKTAIALFVGWNYAMKFKLVKRFQSESVDVSFQMQNFSKCISPQVGFRIQSEPHAKAQTAMQSILCVVGRMVCHSKPIMSLHNNHVQHTNDDVTVGRAFTLYQIIVNCVCWYQTTTTAPNSTSTLYN